MFLMVKTFLKTFFFAAIFLTQFSSAVNNFCQIFNYILIGLLYQSLL